MADNSSSFDTRPEREPLRPDREIYVRLDPDTIRAADLAEWIITQWEDMIRRSTQTNQR